MSLYEGIHRNTDPGAKASFEYLLVYSICFALYLIPVALRHIRGKRRGALTQPASIVGETSTRAANCAATSLMGI
jgi:hypothetical protein